MSISLAAAVPSASPIERLVQAEQVRLSIEQVRRIPIPHFVLDVCVAWTAWNVGLHVFAWVWFAVMTVSQVVRTVHVSGLYRKAAVDPARMINILAAWLVVLGAIHAVLVVRVFLQPESTSHYVLTMIMVGNAAGAVSPAAGQVRSYVMWAGVFGGSLALGWVLGGTLHGAAIAILLVLLFAVLTMYVRDQGRTLVTLVTLSDSLRIERDRAERASAAKTRFFAAASHDLRQPLTALAYNAATVQALASSGQDETLSRVAAGIRRALSEARGLLDSLLEVSKLDAGVVEVAAEPVDLAVLLAEVRESFAPMAAERGLALRLEMEPGANLSTSTDPSVLRRILHNLVDNAIKFTQSGSVTLAAHRGSDQGRAVVRLRVADTGPGIPMEVQEQVFEEFYQVSNAERDRSKGLGLGLAIVRRLAALLGARVTLASEPGRGAVFEVIVPCDEAVAAVAPEPATARPPGEPGEPARRHAVLLIDDERDIRESLQTFLTTLGWQVRSAADQQEALDAVALGFTPQAIVVDLRLRDGASGLDALDALRRHGCAAPAWLITGDTAPERIALARAAGVPVLYKPVDGMELVARMHAALDGSGAGRRAAG